MRISLSLSVLATLLLCNKADAFVRVSPGVVGTPPPPRLLWATVAVNPDMSGVLEEACLDTAARMMRTDVPVSTDIHPNGQVGISYAYWPAAVGRRGSSLFPSFSNNNNNNNKLPPVVLVHGFDSSCLEYRRLGSRLAARGVDTYAVDLLGWGFSQLDGVTSFSAQAKIQALQSFCETVLPGPQFVLGGASLGGAAVIEAAATAIQKKQCVGLVLVDAQGFVDGIGPMAILPTPLAKLGVQVLQSNPLRSAANQMSYFQKEMYATDEAVTIGRIHTLRDGWNDALVSFMQSGGFTPSQYVPKVQVPTLVLWGRQDGILDGNEFAPKFVYAMPNARLHWIEECGHVPHLEQPDETARVIQQFLKDNVVGDAAARLATSRSANGETVPRPFSSTVAAAVGATALLGAYAADLLPLH